MPTRNHQARPAQDEQRKYELWRPIIRPQRRAALERIHHNVADDWSRALAEYLPRGKHIEFEGLSFESYATLNHTDKEGVHSAVFALERSDIGGALLVSAELASCLVLSRLGILEEGSSDGSHKAFTRIETAIIREAMRQLLSILGATYARAGVGAGISRYSERNKDPLALASHDYVLALRFRLDLPPRSLKLTVAISRNIINAVGDLAVGKLGQGSQSTGRVLSQLPVEIDVMLGEWYLPLTELSTLKAGDTIVLPDGADAWLSTNGVRLMTVGVSFSQRRTILTLKSNPSCNVNE
jgi:flagellar motor switch protein FliM